MAVLATVWTYRTEVCAHSRDISSGDGEQVDGGKRGEKWGRLEKGPRAD